MDEEKTNREHKGLKLFMPVLAGIYGMMISVVAGLFIMFDESIKHELMANAVEIIAIAVTLWLAVKILPKWFPQMKNYSFKKPEWTLILAVALCTPLYIAVKYRLIYYIADMVTVLDFRVMTYNAQELKEDLVASLSGVILAPIYEELSFRFIPISIYKKKSTRIVVGIIMAFLFAWLHGRNWISVTVDALLYCTLFLVTGNVWTNICAHACNNLFATILAVLTFFAASEIQMSEGSPLVLLLPWGMTAICAVLAGIGIAVLIQGRKKLKADRDD